MHPEPTSLSYEDRVGAQEAIERVYYSHQIGATRPFEQAVPRQVLESKVRAYLKQSVALERFWNMPVTAAMLRAEVERMTRQTRMPGRLREIFAALGNDPVLIQECLARPALVNRLTRNFFAYDGTIHERAKHEAEAVHEGLVSGRLDPQAEHPNRTLTRRALGDDKEATERSPRTAGVPARPGEIGPLLEERDRFVTQAPLGEEAGAARVASYVFPKKSWDEWWDEVEAHLDEASAEAVASADDALSRSVAAPDGGGTVGAFSPSGTAMSGTATSGDVPDSACASDDVWENGSLDDFPDRRYGHTAVWTGNVMVVWGGTITSSFTTVRLNTGSRYDPATDTWAGVSTINAPEGRSGHTAVWTGSRMLVWGGFGATERLRTGGRYDPATDTWEPMSATGAPSVRFGHTAVWTGSLMVIWGGQGTNSGGRYDPGTDTWTPTSTFNAPAARDKHTAIWTGSLMVIWGGDGEAFGDASFLATGGRYDPVTDTWSPTSMTNAPLRRQDHTAVWTGGRMIVWGGLTSVSGQLTWLDTGGLYYPAADTWTPTSTTDAPSRRRLHSAVWTGDLMVIWGGGPDPSGSASYVQTGGRYDPATDTWTPTATTNAPSVRSAQSAVWTGQHMIIWGGKVDTSLLEVVIHRDTGGRYDPATDSWTPTSRGDAPEARSAHGAVWTGSVMVVWGGQAYDPAINNFPPLSTGGRYDPATDNWTPTSTTNAPAARLLPTTVWTGDEVVIWGGRSDEFNNFNSGGRYDPATDAWTPTSLTDVPAPRSSHTAVWTGTKMIVWGGWDGGSFFDSGGLYEPATDRWLPLSVSNAPSGRSDHTAVWTGSRMIVWGGFDGASEVATGGRYDPGTDQWMPTSVINAPSARALHTAVWTASRMIVWDGFDGTNTPTGGRYDPSTDAWMPVATLDAPASRSYHTAIWTGSQMIVWGGQKPPGTSTLYNTGGRYDPENNRWSPTATGNAPAARWLHTAVWTGELMIVWGGDEALDSRTGGAYCACTSEVYYQDGDGDGHGNPEVWVVSCSPPAGYVTDGTDCDDGVAGAWAVPGEVRDLLFPDEGSMTWRAPANPGSVAPVYDLIRSVDPADFASGAICVVADAADQAAGDSSSPSHQEAFFYLVRAENTCPGGQGPLGTDSDGVPRFGRSCP